MLIEGSRRDSKSTIETRQDGNRHRWNGRYPRWQRNKHRHATRLTPVMCLNVQRFNVFIVTTCINDERTSTIIPLLVRLLLMFFKRRITSPASSIGSCETVSAMAFNVDWTSKTSASRILLQITSTSHKSCSTERPWIFESRYSKQQIVYSFRRSISPRDTRELIKSSLD